jgi:hypothetical protein
VADPWWEEDPETERQGFGIIFHKKGSDWVVHRTLFGSPAEAAEIKPGDVIFAVGERAIQPSARATKLTAAIELLDSNAEHHVAFFRGQQRLVKVMRPQILRELFATDAARGGSRLATCYSCPSCYPRASGVASCPGDCPGYTCTTG